MRGIDVDPGFAMAHARIQELRKVIDDVRVALGAAPGEDIVERAKTLVRERAALLEAKCMVEQAFDNLGVRRR